LTLGAVRSNRHLRGGDHKRVVATRRRRR
jgi:hypothetical protein